MKCKYCGADVEVGKVCEYCLSICEPEIEGVPRKPERPKDKNVKSKNICGDNCSLDCYSSITVLGDLKLYGDNIKITSDSGVTGTCKEIVFKDLEISGDNCKIYGLKRVCGNIEVSGDNCKIYREVYVDHDVMIYGDNCGMSNQVEYNDLEIEGDNFKHF